MLESPGWSTQEALDRGSASELVVLTLHDSKGKSGREFAESVPAAGKPQPSSQLKRSDLERLATQIVAVTAEEWRARAPLETEGGN